MRRLDFYFILLAAAALPIGVIVGIWMGIAEDFQFAPAHAHLNLLAWVSLALFGLTYRAFPALADSWLGTAHFALASIGAIVFPIGIVLAITTHSIGLTVFGSLLWLAGSVLFLANLIRIAFAPAGRSALAPAE